ncbi:MAG: TetR/AcrR family transcriptional regulator [Lachnospiraceae bacterium]|nr:TetR/AcrR family transcriptional regulator [Lachnospiraceae bacterium]
MNERFFALPEEKQRRIINAGFFVFANNSYRKSPMSEIAGAAGISKALLFHYFKNKRELYLFLWDQGAQITMKYLREYGCYEPVELFEMMHRGMRAKLKVMELYPDMTAFVLKAFYENDPSVCGEIQKSYERYFGIQASQALAQVKPEEFRPGLNLQMMYQEMHWAAEGYLWEAMQRGGLEREQLEKDFERLLAFWRSVYGREGGKGETP